jgi:hypothetical protein
MTKAVLLQSSSVSILLRCIVISLDCFIVVWYLPFLQKIFSMREVQLILDNISLRLKN